MGGGGGPATGIGKSNHLGGLFTWNCSTGAQNGMGSNWERSSGK